MLQILITLAIAFALAYLAESLTEYLFAPFFDHVPALTAHKWALMYVSAAAGVGLAFYYRLDLIGAIPATFAETPLEVTPVGMILTGLGIGRGAGWLHDFVSAYIIGPAEDRRADKPVPVTGRYLEAVRDDDSGLGIGGWPQD